VFYLNVRIYCEIKRWWHSRSTRLFYQDSTDISKLTAYYALYSKIPSFIDGAARVLFQEIPAVGILPVSVPGIGYEFKQGHIA
jgi:hypothetical protein